MPLDHIVTVTSRPGYIPTSKMANSTSTLSTAALRRLKKKKQKEREQVGTSLTKSQSVPGIAIRLINSY